MSASSEHAVLVALEAVVRDHGWQTAGDPTRLRGMLNDVLGATADEHRGAVDALVVAAEDGVPEAIRAAGPVGLAMVEGDLVGDLEEWGLRPERAAWAVRAWADLAPAPTIPPPATATPVTTVPQAAAPLDAAPENSAGAAAGPAAGPAAVPQALGPTELPPVADLTALPADATPPEALDQSTPEDSDMARAAGPSRPRRSPSARAAALAVTAVVVLAGAGVAAVLATSGGDPNGAAAVADPTHDTTDAASSTGSSSPQATPSAGAPPAAQGTELIPAPGVRPQPVSGTVAMAARTVGVRLAGLAEVDQVGTGEAALSRPEGGRLIAFRLADWKGCNAQQCRPWSKADLAVAVGKDVRPLPAGDGVYVVAVPRRSDSVDLVMRADGHRQTLSLKNGRAGRDNIAVLARRDRRSVIDSSFGLTETASITLSWFDGSVGTSAVRDVTVRSSRLDYFFGSQHARTPGEGLLFFDATYRLPGSSAVNSFYVGEMKFRAGDGTVYDARDLDPGPAVHAVFDVPADVDRGWLLLGGTIARTAGSTSYTSTLASRAVPVRFAG